jgi:hypothetical protein
MLVAAEAPEPDRPGDPRPPPEAPARPRVRPVLGPDLDGGCLEEARARAVALALAEPERARSFVERAAHAAWLPELRVRYDRVLRRSESIDASTAGDDVPLGLATANEIRYEARATWDLGRLAFSPDEIAAEYQALRMADTRRELESQVNRLYFERRRLLAEDTGGGRASDETRRLVHLEELDAELDALSGGTFSRCRRASGPGWRR